MRLLPPTADEAEQKAQQPASGVSRRAETLRSGLQAIVAGDAGTRLTLLSRQGLTLSSEAGRRLYSCCRPDVRSGIVLRVSMTQSTCVHSERRHGRLDAPLGPRAARDGHSAIVVGKRAAHSWPECVAHMVSRTVVVGTVPRMRMRRQKAAT